MQRTNIYLDERQVEALDRLAQTEGVSRAEVIRRLLDRQLDRRDDSLQADLVAIEGSFGAAAGVEPTPRGADERALHLDRIWRLGT